MGASRSMAGVMVAGTAMMLMTYSLAVAAEETPFTGDSIEVVTDQTVYWSDSPILVLVKYTNRGEAQELVAAELVSKGVSAVLTVTKPYAGRAEVLPTIFTSALLVDQTPLPLPSLTVGAHSSRVIAYGTIPSRTLKPGQVYRLHVGVKVFESATPVLRTSATTFVKIK